MKITLWSRVIRSLWFLRRSLDSCQTYREFIECLFSTPTLITSNLPVFSFFFFFFQLSNTRIFQRSFRSSRELYGKKKKEKCFKSKDSRFSIQNLIFSIVNLRYILLQSERLISLIHNPLTPECLFENSSISKKKPNLFRKQRSASTWYYSFPYPREKDQRQKGTIPFPPYVHRSKSPVS